MKTKFFLTLLLGICTFCAYSQTPSAKEVQTDKSGRFIYSLARDADPEVAFSVAYTDLVNKLQPKADQYGIDLLKKSIQRIDNEAFNIHRVILFVDFENLNTEGVAIVEEPAEVLPEEPVVTNLEITDVSVTESIEEKSAAPVAETVEMMAVEEAPAQDTVEILETAIEETPMTVVESATEINDSVAEASPVQTVALPDGRLGDTIRYIMEQESIKGVQNQLEKARNSMVISQYGSGPTKYVDHAFLITIQGKNIEVYSPRDKAGSRTNYATGETGPEIKGTKIYWFLKR